MCICKSIIFCQAEVAEEDSVEEKMEETQKKENTEEANVPEGDEDDQMPLEGEFQVMDQIGAPDSGTPEGESGWYFVHLERKKLWLMLSGYFRF